MFDSVKLTESLLSSFQPVVNSAHQHLSLQHQHPHQWIWSWGTLPVHRTQSRSSLSGENHGPDGSSLDTVRVLEDNQTSKANELEQRDLQQYRESEGFDEGERKRAWLSFLLKERERQQLADEEHQATPRCESTMEQTTQDSIDIENSLLSLPFLSEFSSVRNDILAVDFGAWKNAALGWRESFVDLLAKQGDRERRRESGIIEDIAAERDSGDWTQAVELDLDDSADGRISGQHGHVEISTSIVDVVEQQLSSKDQEKETNPINDIATSAIKKELTFLETNLPRRSHSVSLGSDDDDTLSFHEVDEEEISPDPANGDFYESDSDSYRSMPLSLDDHSDHIGEDTTESGGHRSRRYRRYRYRRSLMPSRAQIDQLALRTEENDLLFVLSPTVSLAAQLYLWPSTARIVVVDLETFVFKPVPQPNGLSSLWFTTPSKRQVADDDAVRLLQAIAQQGYRLLYFASSFSNVSRWPANSSSKAFFDAISNTTIPDKSKTDITPIVKHNHDGLPPGRYN
jgi:hypothetical protein